ncbi:TPA: opacity family porin, partial [Neisseria gonorrhoeae]
FGGWRIAADYARYRKWNNSKYSVNTKKARENKNSKKGTTVTEYLKAENQENGTFHAASSLGLSAVYDFDTGSRFKPYAGVRVAYGHVRHSIDSTKKTTRFLTSSYGGAKPTVYPEENTQDAHRESNSIRRVG